MNRQTQEVFAATAEQKRGGELILQSTEEISGGAREAQAAVQQLVKAAQDLSDAGRTGSPGWSDVPCLSWTALLAHRRRGRVVAAPRPRELRSDGAVRPTPAPGAGRQLAGDDASPAQRGPHGPRGAVLSSPAPSPGPPPWRCSSELRSADGADVRVLAASALGEAGNRAAAGPPLVGALSDPIPTWWRRPPTPWASSAFAPATGRRCRTSAGPGIFWVRAAAVVALGRLRTSGHPILARVARGAGLSGAGAEALRDRPSDALAVLGTVQARAPREALIAAGSILAAHPDVDPPEWVAEWARWKPKRSAPCWSRKTTRRWPGCWASPPPPPPWRRSSPWWARPAGARRPSPGSWRSRPTSGRAP
jgi:hypothetical protein